MGDEEEVKREWQAAMDVSADWLNNPAKTDEIALRFKRMLDGFHHRYEAQPAGSGHASDVIVTVTVASAKARPVIDHKGDEVIGGDPGVEPWKP